MLVRLAGDRCEINVQNPLALGEGDEPQPDLALAKEDPSRRRLPGPEDVLLVVEVSDTTLDIKLPLYAAVGVPEAWIVDLQNRKVEIHTNPKPDGYQTTQEFGPGRSLRSETLEGPPLPIDDFLA